MYSLDVLSVLLLVATPLSYLAQCIRITRLRSSNGISLLASLLMALVAQHQLVTIYYIFRNHPDTLYGGIFTTPRTAQDWLVVVQIVVQWACSLSLFGFVVASHKTPASDSPNESTTYNGPSRNILTSGQIAIALILIHASLSVAFGLVAGKPAGRWDNLAFLSIMSFCTDIANPVATIVTVVAFAYQTNRSNKIIATSRRSQGSRSHALSSQALALQSATFFALAISWPFRFKLPGNIGRLEAGWLWVLGAWYPNVGWPCVNNGIIAIGQSILLYVESRADTSGDQGFPDERNALLSS